MKALRARWQLDTDSRLLGPILAAPSLVVIVDEMFNPQDQHVWNAFTD